MLNISQFQLFLFDFDGLLVNTEELHFEAYKTLTAQRGYHFPIDFATYLRHALFQADALRDLIYLANPGLKDNGPPWKELYVEKKKIYQRILENKGVSLMSGTAELLKLLEARKIKRAIVTNSTREQVEMIREFNPILKTIPHLITREDYIHPKPSSECYEKALDMLSEPADRVIGFEDSPRGLAALLGSKREGIVLDGVLVSSLFKKAEIEPIVKKPFHHISSLEALLRE